MKAHISQELPSIGPSYRDCRAIIPHEHRGNKTPAIKSYPPPRFTEISTRLNRNRTLAIIGALACASAVLFLGAVCSGQTFPFGYFDFRNGLSPKEPVFGPETNNAYLQ